MLTRHQTGVEVRLRVRTTGGRDVGNDLMLSDSEASAQHAVIQWVGKRWVVRDLASTNGTWVHEKRIAPGAAVPLELGKSVAFGNPRVRWWMMAVDPPGLFAESLVDDRRVDAQDGVLGLPSNDDPRVMVFPGYPTWVVEDAKGTRPVGDRAVVVVEGVPWRLAVPESLEGTAGLTVTRSAVRVRVSGTMHLPKVQVAVDGRWETLRAASSDRLLWLLARERASDRRHEGEDLGLTHIDLVGSELGIDPKSVDVYVHRLRKRLSKRGVHDLIERRPGVGQLRLAFDRVEWRPDGASATA